MNKTNDLSKSIEHFDNLASGIKFAFKGKSRADDKFTHREFYQNNEYSCEIELEDKPEIGGKLRNKNIFKPSTKQTIDQNEYKKLKKKYDFEEIEEKIEEEQIKDDKKSSMKKSENSETPRSKNNRNNIYTEQYRQKKIIFDDDEEENDDEFKFNYKNINKKQFEEDKIINLDNSKEESDKEKEKDKNSEDDEDNNDNNKEKKNKKGKNKNKDKKNKNNKKKNNKKKKNKSKDRDKEKEKESSDNNYNNEDKDNNSDNNDKEEIEEKKNNKNKKKVYKKSKKWNEAEYQKILSESKNYIPFKDYDINKYLLTKSQLKNIQQIPELYERYMEFISLKEKQDKIQFDTLVKNILQIFNNIYKIKHVSVDFTVNSLFKNQDLSQFDFKSSEKTAYFDLFISFISMYTSEYNSFIESSSILDTNKLIVPMHSLAFIFSSQRFFTDMARLIQNYYNKFLSYRIIPINKKESEEYSHKINSRKIIWKQFEAPFLYFKNNKNLYLKEGKLDEKKIDDFANKVSENINEAYNNFAENIIEKHRNINIFSIDDKRINLTDAKTSVPSSLYNQINGDVLFNIKMNLYKYKMKLLKIKKLCQINEAKMKISDFNDTIKNKIFRQSVYYMNPYDVAQDFLDNYN